MNKTELIEITAEKAGITKKDAKLAVEAAIASVVETVAKGEPVQLVGFGTFSKRERAQRMARNPQTGEQTVVPACSVPAFKAGKEFKNALK